jgi:hypothetical protein
MYVDMLCLLCLEDKAVFVTRSGKNVICKDCANKLTADELTRALEKLCLLSEHE